MRNVWLASLLLLWTLPGHLYAQQPFYTEDPAVTPKGKFHLEFFNEFDSLQPSLFPNLKQNTTNYKLNYGLIDNLEVGVDSPYLTIFRNSSANPRRRYGIGDTNLAVKWNFHKELEGSRIPALAVGLNFEFPTGDESQQLGSGLVDYWLYGIAQKSLTDRTRLTANGGILFAGNTSVGALGIQTKGRIATAGASLIRKFNPKLALGFEITGAASNNLNLAKGQLQFLVGGNYALKKGLTFDFGVLGGRYPGAPRAGLQLGVSIDLPNDAVFPKSNAAQ